MRSRPKSNFCPVVTQQSDQPSALSHCLPEGIGSSHAEYALHMFNIKVLRLSLSLGSGAAKGVAMVALHDFALQGVVCKGG